MAGSVLVAYATKMGSAQEVAETVAEVLRESGFAVVVTPAGSAKNAADFDAVVLGTGIRAGRVYGEAVKFAKANASLLAGKPVALFSVGMQMAEDTEANRAQAKAFLQPLIDDLKPVAVATFGGKVDLKKAGLIWGAAYKMVAKQKQKEGSGGDPFADYRDWDAIKAWAAGLPDILNLSE